MRISCRVIGHGAKRYILSSIYLYHIKLTNIEQDLIAKDKATHGATYVPLIFGSDKTTVSVATGQNEFYPFYMSNGLIYNNVRRAHRNGVVLVAFLSIPKSTFPF
jgi:hypothetical protein